MSALSRLTGIFLLALIFLALFVPTSYQEVKALLLVLALLGVLILAFFDCACWTRDTLLAVGVLALVGLANSLHGSVAGALGAFSVLTLMFVWPVLFAILSAMMNLTGAIKSLLMTFKFSLVCILIYCGLYLGSMVGLVPDAFYFELDQGQGVGFYDGRVEFTLLSIASLFFLLPLWIHNVLIGASLGRVGVFNWCVLFIALTLVTFSGRRALQLVIVLSPFIAVFVQLILSPGWSLIRFLKKLFNWKSLFILIVGLSSVALVLLSMDVRVDAVLDEFASGFDFEDSSNESSAVRGQQFVSMIHGWSEGNVLFGAGNGSHAEYFRSPDMPWAYELTYVYLLFSTGIIGVLFYFSWFFWGLLRVRCALTLRSDMTNFVAPIISGTLGLAIGASSNPYFSKFDYLWILFLPHLMAGAIRFQKIEERGRLG